MTAQKRKSRGVAQKAEAAQQPAAAEIRLAGELTIYTASAVKRTLVDALAQDVDLAIDLSGVSEIDTAGLQLLLMARHHSARGGHTLRLLSPDACVRDVLELCNLHALFALDTQTQLDLKEAV